MSTTNVSKKFEIAETKSTVRLSWRKYATINEHIHSQRPGPALFPLQTPFKGYSCMPPYLHSKLPFTAWRKKVIIFRVDKSITMSGRSIPHILDAS